MNEQETLRAIRYQATDLLADIKLHHMPIEMQIKTYRSTLETMAERIAKLLEPYNDEVV